ncbi:MULTISPECIES: hypothetical protein [Erysipelothrix]|uniref:Uncharacterized protein n=1 Tax=Erysipelothrix piscisicarius TaxID=2485784 RepID=A0A3S8RMJ2_9FIRM|nr:MULTISPECIES: hypothetical protein [Erysipelothrix]AZK44174.1 hypothetical protein EEI45_04925 [Erysipelothrix piscisicarius]MBK2402275.1 hypothetical protein [Erysipelothrix sp. strain 2 (EsS2-6-Brazil)]MBK2404484.1 hypothetical protein [Erysipelothrix sp. strain 2 (EsS2-7-Brazil)]NBA01949.1 hypothetical protein [Erysipelothrix rhusiopathiae]
MDEHILRILKANQSAKQLVHEHELTNEFDQEHFEELKKSIDNALSEVFEHESAKIREESNARYERLKPMSDHEYNERVKDLDERFNVAKKEWEQILFKRITTLDGK